MTDVDEQIKLPSANDAIFKALLEAQRHISRIEKDATNQHHKYSYVSSEAMILAAREALHLAGLFAFRPDWKIRYPSEGNQLELEATMVLVHAETGQRMIDRVYWPIVPGQGRPMDKAVASALTVSQSYWLRDLLQIPRTDPDTEMDSRDDTGYRPEPRLTQAPVTKGDTTYISPSTVLKLTNSLQSSGLTVEKFCQGMGIPTIDRLPANRVDEAVQRITDYAEKKKAEEATPKPQTEES